MIILLENFFLKVASKVAKVLTNTKITPKQITLARFIIAAPLSLYFFSKGIYLYNLIGLFLYMLLAILDWVDGSLARMKQLPKKTYPLGKLIDNTLDRILMLVTLGSIFYAGVNSDTGKTWSAMIIIYFSFFFFLTVLTHEFDKITGLEYKKYPKIEKKLFKKKKSLSLKEQLLWNFIYVGHSSMARFCFTVSYPLFLGIISNQLILAFVFITLMIALRSIMVFSTLYCVLNIKKTDSVLINVLKRRAAKTRQKSLTLSN